MNTQVDTSMTARQHWQHATRAYQQEADMWNKAGQYKLGQQALDDAIECFANTTEATS